jgi:hypothetical protein
LIKKIYFFYLQFVLLRQPARLQKWMPTWWPIWNWHKNYTEEELCVILLTTFDDDDVTSQMSLFTR